MWVIVLRKQPHEIDHIDHANPQVGWPVTDDVCGREGLERRTSPAHASTTSGNGAGYVVLGHSQMPSAAGAVLGRVVHREPIELRLLARDDDVDVLPRRGSGRSWRAACCVRRR